MFIIIRFIYNLKKTKLNKNNAYIQNAKIVHIQIQSSFQFLNHFSLILSMFHVEHLTIKKLNYPEKKQSLKKET